MIRIWDFTAGSVYRQVVIIKERLRFRRSRVSDEITGLWTFKDLVVYSAKVLLISSLIFFALLQLNWPILHYRGELLKLFASLGLTFQGIQALQNFLGYIVGALTALLAIVYAAAATGFQVSAAKYSSEVSRFLLENEDFQRLTKIFLAADVFSFTTLIGFSVFGAKAYAALILTYLLALLAVIYVARFSFSLFGMYRPRSIFNGILWSTDQQLVAISSGDYRSRSWNVVSNARSKINDKLKILEELYSSLHKQKAFDDAYHATKPIHFLLRRYAEVEHRLQDSDRPWWGQETQEFITSDNWTMAEIKANYEIKSEGRLYVPGRDKDWLPRRLRELLKRIRKDAIIEKSYIQFRAAMLAYGHSLYGNMKDVRGTIQLSNFSISRQLISDFLDVEVDEIDGQMLEAWLDVLFTVSISIFNADEDSNIGAIAAKCYEDVASGHSCHQRIKSETGSRYAILESYSRKISIEKDIEGQIVTPKERFIEEIESSWQKNKRSFIDEFLPKLLDASNTALKRAYTLKASDLVASVMWMQYRWINHGFVNHNYDQARLVNILAEKNVGYLIYLPARYIKKTELLEEIEKGYFISILEQQKDSYVTFLRAVALVRIATWQEDLKDQRKLYRNMRRLYVHGMFAFYASEYYQDSFYIEKFLELTAKTLKVNIFDYLLQVFDFQRKFISTRDFLWESQTFLRWQRSLAGKMKKNLNQITDPGGPGFTTIYDHPSKYIQKLGYMHDLLGMDFGDDDFKEWLDLQKKRCELIEALKRRP